jgi:branched-chain amino acid transport system ATP-binding protein
VDRLLELRKLDAAYGEVQVLWDCSLHIGKGEIVALFGGNGAGKTTMLRVISGLIRPKAGDVSFDGRGISTIPAHELPGLGIAHVPEGRHVFPQMTVKENLEMGAYPKHLRGRREERMASVFDLFPVLREKAKAQAGVLSGGQQQMLAIGRGLMAEPKLLLLDEPSLGLAPAVVATLFETIARIRSLGVTVLLVEQNLWKSLEVADRYYLIASGKIVTSGVPGKLREDEAFRRAYFGV